MRGVIKRICAAAAVIATLGAAQAVAEDLFRAIVKVNDDVITGYDLQQRIGLLTLASGGQPPDNIQRLALNSLVEDRLKLQQARQLGLELSDEQLQGAVAQVARNNNSSPESFLEALDQNRIDRESFFAQLTADVLWNEVIRQRFGERLRPSDGEVEAEVESAAASGGAVQYRMKQIVVAVARNANQQTVSQRLARAKQAKGRMTDCNAAASMASSFDRPSGDMPAMTEAAMPPQLRDQVVKMKIGDTFGPVRSQAGFHILILCARQEGDGAAPDREAVFQRLVRTKADSYSKSYLEDVRRDALIETNM